MNSIFAVAGVVVLELVRRKEAYVLLALTILLGTSLASLSFFNDQKIVRFLKEACLSMIWICSLIICIGLTARQLPSEQESRTLFPLLAKPLARHQLILGKFFGCWLACGLSLLCFYLFFALLTSSREESVLWSSYFQLLVFHWWMLGIISSVTLLGSLVFAAPSSNATICFIVAAGILLVGRYLNIVALQIDQPGRGLLYSIYYLIPHLEFYDVRNLVIHRWPLIRWSTWLLALAYGAAYMVVFLAASCWVFRRKSIV